MVTHDGLPRPCPGHSPQESRCESPVLDLSPIFRLGRVAVIFEECHRSHFEGSKTANALRRLRLGAGPGQGPVVGQVGEHGA